MEEQIQDKLEEIYNIPVDVKFIDFRQYGICVSIENGKRLICFPFLYENRTTFEVNIQNIVDKINSEIPKLYMKEG